MFFRFLILSLFISLILASGVSAKDYRIDEVQITAAIQEDGSVRISETRTFYFDGSFSWVEQTIRRQGFGELRDFSASINGREIRMDGSGDPDTFRLRERRNSAELRWNFRAENEAMQIGAAYTITEVLPADGKWAQFYWNLIGRDWDVPSNNITITFTFPEDVPDSELFTWSRNELPGEALIIEDGTITFTADRLRSGRRLTLRTVFPARILHTAAEADEPIDPELFEAAHWQWVEARERRAERLAAIAPYADKAGLFLTFLNVVIIIVVLAKYSRSEAPGFNPPDKLDHPPSQEKPAFIGWMFAWQSVQAYHITATILDLARRGYFRILQEKKPDSKKEEVILLEKTDQSPENLADWEFTLHQFLNKKIDGGTRDFSKLFKKEADQKWMNKWMSSVRKAAKQNNWFIEQPKVIGWMITVQALFLLAMVLVFIYASTPVFGFFMMLTVTAGFITPVFLNPRNEEGEIVYRNWKAYMNALKSGKVSDKPEYAPFHIIYGVVFALGTKKLEKLMHQIRYEEADLTWLHLSTSAGVLNPAMLAGSISSASSSITSSVSGSSGVSVGAAGGGGGGSAG